MRSVINVFISSSSLFREYLLFNWSFYKLIVFVIHLHCVFLVEFFVADPDSGAVLSATSGLSH